MNWLKKNIDKHYRIVVAVILSITAFFRFYKLNVPNWKVFDEIYYADFAQKHLTHGTYFDVHPPLSKIIISAGIKLFGDNSLGWRVSEAFLGFILLVLIFLLAYQIFKNKYIALISLILSCTCTMLFVESRLSLINIFIVFFVVLSLNLFFYWSEKKKVYLLLLSGIALALAVLVKWTAIYIFIPMLFYLLVKENLRLEFYKDFIKKWYFGILLILLPIVTYIGIFQLTNISEFNFIEWHKQAFGFHHNLTATHPYSSPWYTWLLGIRPICLEYKDIGDGQIVGILEIPNIPMFWTAIVAILWSAYSVYKNKKNTHELLFLIVGIFAIMIPWAFIKRISFIYLFLPAVPLIIIVASNFIYKILKTKYNYLAIIILLLIIGWFVFFYPILVGTPITPDQYQERMLLKSWI